MSSGGDPAATDDWADLMERVHEFHKEYILAVDRKASILLTGLLGMLGLVANAIAISPPDFRLDGVAFALFVLSGFFGLISIVFAAWVVYPRVYDTSFRGYIYWERILRHGSREEFLETVTSTPDTTTPRREVAKTCTIWPISRRGSTRGSGGR